MKLADFHPVQTLRLGGRNDDLGLFALQAQMGPAWSVLVDGELCACFGIYAPAGEPAELWMLLGEEARRRYPVLTVKIARRVLCCIEQYPRLTSVQVGIKRDDERARRYAHHLGFHVEQPTTAPVAVLRKDW